MILHHPNLVRMFRPDQTFHCVVHGRLEGDETEAFLRMIRLTPRMILATDHWPWYKRLLLRIMDARVSLQNRLRPPHCVVVP